MTYLLKRTTTYNEYVDFCWNNDMIPTPQWFNWKQHRGRVMNLESRFEDLQTKVLSWAKDKGIFDVGTPAGQYRKLLEEVDELGKALSDGDNEQIIDGVGDSVVVLIILAKMLNLNLVDCLESAYNVIAKRTGVMKDGVFVKDE
jgi:NTP pyrophosphatase (non-canonical NTP hydrolase)